MTNNSPPQKGIVVFIKTPVAGKVKTRLASTMGDERALAIYKQLIGTTLDLVAAQSDVTIYLYYFPTIVDEYNIDGAEQRVQVGSDLGEKMYNAFAEALRHCDQVLILGTDCPFITSQQITEAFEALGSNDVVLGPAEDGGYYLIGLCKAHPHLFENIQWSTSQVLSSTLQKVSDEKLSVALLKTLSDIDHESDWNRYLDYLETYESTSEAM